jgi:hypothetical protein
MKLCHLPENEWNWRSCYIKLARPRKTNTTFLSYVESTFGGGKDMKVEEGLFGKRKGTIWGVVEHGQSTLYRCMKMP